jgi:outer membrane murein-binding lipoprotein Lpp
MQGWRKVAVVWGGAVVLGVLAALGGRMYTHHAEQHWAAEQLAQKVQQLEAQQVQIIQVVNQLAARR